MLATSEIMRIPYVKQLLGKIVKTWLKPVFVWKLTVFASFVLQSIKFSTELPVFNGNSDNLRSFWKTVSNPQLQSSIKYWKNEIFTYFFYKIIPRMYIFNRASLFNPCSIYKKIFFSTSGHTVRGRRDVATCPSFDNSYWTRQHRISS